MISLLSLLVHLCSLALAPSFSLPLYALLVQKALGPMLTFLQYMKHIMYSRISRLRYHLQCYQNTWNTFFACVGRDVLSLVTSILDAENWSRLITRAPSPVTLAPSPRYPSTECMFFIYSLVSVRRLSARRNCSLHDTYCDGWVHTH